MLARATYARTDLLYIAAGAAAGATATYIYILISTYILVLVLVLLQCWECVDASRRTGVRRRPLGMILFCPLPFRPQLAQIPPAEQPLLIFGHASSSAGCQCFDASSSSAGRPCCDDSSSSAGRQCFDASSSSAGRRSEPRVSLGKA